jgi:perosamine synthetase
MFAEFNGGGHALAVSNGTVALHLALVALGIGPGDEVIVPNLTFAASINVIIYTGATPVLVDVDDATWTLDIEKTKQALTPRTKAIMPVHLYGHPCRMTPLIELAKQKNLHLVEDCAEALGAGYRGQPVGTFGAAGCFSFFGNKMITTGEGGMILFKDQALYEQARMLRDHGMDPSKRYWHKEVGFNYRLTNLQAAIGVAQMEQIQQFVHKKQQLSKLYSEMLADVAGLTLPPHHDWAQSICWLYTILLDPSTGINRDELLLKLLHNGVESRPLFYPLHTMPPYQRYSTGVSFPVSERLSRMGLSLPSAVTLSETDARHVCEAIRKILSSRQLFTASHAPTWGAR